MTGRERKKGTKEEAVYYLLLDIARWFCDDCMYEEGAREGLQKIGFEEKLINTARS